MVRRPSDNSLRRTYDSSFIAQANDENSRAGMAHNAGLRAVYDRGKADGIKEQRKVQKKQ